MQILFLIGRILLGGYFVYSGYNHFKNLDGMTGYAKMKGVPIARASVVVTGLMMALGGVAIIINRYAIIGMCLVILFLIPTTIMMHKFWKEADANAKMGERINFTKNLALIGAIIIIILISIG
jgi:uncharacterized membrane protein YphA (DoxX/SURF4 family)